MPLNSKSYQCDFRYLGSQHFLKIPLYQGEVSFFLAKPALIKFERACSFLHQLAPHLKFLIWDSLRPTQVQRLMFEALSLTPYQNYVANPNPGSLHNFGMAIDLTLWDSNQGKALGMGTDFDDFSELSQPQLESKFTNDGLLSQEALANRLLLRKVMTQAGFETLAHEWWHFGAAPSSEVYGKLPKWSISESLARDESQREPLKD